MIKVGIIGGAGYTAGELIRLLLNHPSVTLGFVHSESNAGKYLWEVHEGIFGETDIRFASEYDLSSVDCLFMCGGHGKSTEFWAANECPETLRVVDLAQDYRDESCGYVYGLPEMQREKICGAPLVANPGCFATAIQLALLPFKEILKGGSVSVNALTGSTGAGVKPSTTTHFSYRNNNISTYKVFSHQHLAEICRNVPSCSVDFIPYRGDFARGIFCTAVFPTALDGEALASMARDYYKDAAFTHYCDFAPDLKQVVNTNKALVNVQAIGGKAVVTSVVDNLLKGASGQAVQNMNLMFGLPEDSGLRLKASAF